MRFFTCLKVYGPKYRAPLLLLLTLAISGVAGIGCKTLMLTDKQQKSSNYVVQGNAYAKDGLWREAIESYKHALAKEENNLTIHRNIGMVFVKVGDYKSAVYHLEKSITKFDDNFASNFYLAEAYRGLDNYGEAIYRYKKALKLKDDSTKVLKALAWSYFKIRYYSEALITAKKLLALSPKDEQASIIMARTLLKLKRGQEALTILRSAKEKAVPTNVAYFESVEGDILSELGDFEGALKVYFSALKAQPLLPGALLGIGRSFLDNNDPKKAISYMERALRVKTNLAEAQYLLGKAYEQVDTQKSIRYYQLFAKQAATDPEFLTQVLEVKQRLGTLQKANSDTNNASENGANRVRK